MSKSGLIQKLVDLLDHPSPHVRQPALRSIGNIATGSDMNTDNVINCGVLLKLKKLLSSDITSPNSMKREICWTISNITAGPEKQIEQVIKAEILPSLINILKNGKYEIAKEALWAISNATSGGDDAQIKYLVNLGVIPSVCSFLKKVTSTKIFLVSLECLENILSIGSGKENINNYGQNRYAVAVEECGGLKLLEELTANDQIPNEIYEKIIGLLEEHWQQENEENNNK
eukprot:450212_1